MIARNQIFPYLLDVSIPYSEKSVSFLRSLQGAQWNTTSKTWQVPEEYEDSLGSFGPMEGGPTGPTAKGPSELSKALMLQIRAKARARREYQLKAVERGFQAHGGFILAFEMKLGKSATALDIARLRGYKRVLILGPAASMPTWERQIAKWWPEQANSTFWLEKTPRLLGKNAAALWFLHKSKGASITLCSYKMLPKLMEDCAHEWDCIIADEMHALSRNVSKQSQAAERLRAENPRAFMLGLTGTVQANETESLYGPLNFLFPQRYGLFYTPSQPARSFAGRYTNVEWNGYGHDFRSINPKTASELDQKRLAELNWRLSCVMSRVTKKEVAHLLPPLTAESRRKEKDFNLRQIVEDEIKQGATGIAIMCALNATWNAAFTELSQIKQEGLSVALVTGEETPKKRDETLETLKKAPIKVGIFSIAACAMTIDLSAFPNVHFIELVDKTWQASQVVGRFQVPDMPNPIFMTFHYDEKSFEQAQRLERKFEVTAAVMQTGQSEEQMRAAFSTQSRFTKEAWDAAIDDALAFTF